MSAKMQIHLNDATSDATDERKKLRSPLSMFKLETSMPNASVAGYNEALH